MYKYRFLFNIQTLLILIVSLLSSFMAIRFQISVHVDFIFLSLFIAFPLTFSLRESFRRREKSLEYLSTFYASLESSHYYFELSELEQDKKLEFKKILSNTSRTLIQYLSGIEGDVSKVQIASDDVFHYLNANSETFKSKFSEKVLSFQYRINESIKFLLSAKEHRTPWGVRAIILFGCYLFVIFYPCSVVSEAGFDISIGYLFAMTGFKGLILIALCNVQILLEDPFIHESPEGIMLNKFHFTGLMNSPNDLKKNTTEKTEPI